MVRKTASYRDAGVDIAAGDRFSRKIGKIARGLRAPGWLPDPGGFAGLFRVGALRMKDPVLVSGTDGVGTKLAVAAAARRHDTIGIDLVAMCVNDILVTGARPLFFLDYIVTARLQPEILTDVIRGVVEGCRRAGCVLIGGETAEHPGEFPKGRYDLAGFAVGAVERSRLLGKQRVRRGDVLIGLPSSGIHSNGFSLARAALGVDGARSLRRRVPGTDDRLADALLRPTTIYVEPVLDLLRQRGLGGEVRAAAHITGGGLRGNVRRVIPRGLRASIDSRSWEVPPLFDLIRRDGDISAAEMARVFNMGIGFVLVVSARGAARAARRLGKGGWGARIIGEVVPVTRRSG